MLVLELADGAVVQALVASAQDIPRYRLGQRVRVVYSLGHHGETLYTVTKPVRWRGLFG